jgi:hypothetical protein
MRGGAHATFNWRETTALSGKSYNPGVLCRAYAGVTLWYLGYPDQALQRSREALTLARELVHPVSLATALLFAAWVHHFRREGPLIQERAEATIALAAEQGFTAIRAHGTIFQGWALAQRSAAPGTGQGCREEAIAQIRQGLAAWRATGAQVFGPVTGFVQYAPMLLL